jgi:hypothetical protein
MGCEISPNMIICRKAGGTGCPETNGGAHYFIYMEPDYEKRHCMDCGAPEEDDGNA